MSAARQIIRGLLFSVEDAPFHVANFTMDLEVIKSEVLTEAVEVIRTELERRSGVARMTQQHWCTTHRRPFDPATGCPDATLKATDAQFIPDRFECPKCEYVHQGIKGQTLIPKRCPNDGELMGPVTWEGAYKKSVGIVAELVKLIEVIMMIIPADMMETRCFTESERLIHVALYDEVKPEPDTKVT